MANILTFVGYSRASGGNPFLRVYSAVFSGSYAQNYTEVLNFATALNPSGIEDAAFPISSPPSIDPFVLSHTCGGNLPELQIGGNGSAGQFGINFYTGGNTQLAAGTYSGAGFPANGSNYGEVLIGVMMGQ